MTEELKIKVTAEVKDFKKGMEEAEEALDEVEKKSEESKSKLSKLSSKLASLSPSFKAMSEKWRESSEKIDETFGKNTLAAKGFKVAAIAALVAIAAKAASTAWKVAKETARMFDPKGYSKAAGAAEKSMTRLKTAVGSFTAPIVNALYTVFSKIIDGITWVVEKLRIGVAVITGVIKAVFQPIVDGIRNAVSWLKNAINTLGEFLGIGKIFKETSKNAKEAADEMEAVVDATSAGLAGFDKLTTLDFSNMGDAEEAEKISESISDAEENGKKLVENLNGFFKKFDFGGVWDRFKTGTISAFGTAGEKLRTFFTDMGSGIGSAWGDFTEYAGRAISGAIDTIGSIGSQLGEKLGEAWNTFTTVGGEIFGSLWSTLSEGWEFVSGKIVGVWNSFTSSASQTFGGLWSSVESGWNTVKNNILGVWDGFKSWASNAFSNLWSGVSGGWNTVKNNILGVWDSFKSTASNAFSGLWSWVSGGWNTVSSKILGVWDSFKSWASNAFSGLWSWVSGGWKKVSDNILGVWDSFKTWARDKFSGLWDTVKGSWDTVKNNIIGVWDNFKKKASEIFEEIKKIFANGIELVIKPIVGENGMTGGGLEMAEDKKKAWWDIFKGFFGLASGGAVAPNNPMPYILGDNKREYEVVSPVSLMESTVMSALKKAGVGSGGTGSSQPIDITIQLDGKKVARAIYDPLETERRRRGARA